MIRIESKKKGLLPLHPHPYDCHKENGWHTQTGNKVAAGNEYGECCGNQRDDDFRYDRFCKMEFDE